MKAEYWSMIAGAIIGSVLGIYIGTRILTKCHICEDLKQENKMLREVILEQQRMYYSR